MSVLNCQRFSFFLLMINSRLIIRLCCVVFLGLTISCDESFCENNLIAEALSPDGHYIASVFEWNCGATTPSIFVVSLRRAEVAFEPADDDWVFSIHDKTPISIAWHDKILRIGYIQMFDKPTKKYKWNDVSIEYSLYSYDNQ